jgi:septal ring factor EnvC (AmiA/AmiB activator)
LYYVSSTSANELFRKWIYLNQIEDWQEARRQQIKATKKQLLEQQEAAKEEQLALNRKLKQEEANARALDQDLEQEQRLLAQLKSKEGSLKAKLKQQVRERKQLDNAIARVIEEARKEEKKEEKTAFAETPAGKAVSGAFAKNKGRLPWPVDKGVVTRQFGKQKHPTLSNLYIQNNGVDIATEKDAIVKALFKGEVLGVVEVPGYQKMVIIQHGEYYSVYSRMAEVSVKKGDQVQMGSHIGQAYTHPEEGNTLVHLEVWQDKKKLDPLDWLVGR